MSQKQRTNCGVFPPASRAAKGLLLAAALGISACGGGSGGSGGSGSTAGTSVLTIDSVNPASGAGITASPSDTQGQTSGTTSNSGLAMSYPTGTTVTLTASPTAGSNHFSSWSGCASAQGTRCTVVVQGNATVTANYAVPVITAVSVSAATITVGSAQQLTATVTGSGSYSTAVTWAVSLPAGSAGSGLSPGTIDANGLYTTPYPAPATVTVTATSVQDPTVSGSAVLTLSTPAASAGPALTVDTSNPAHAISPLIYGMNFFQLNSSAAKAARITVDRWGGDATSRYNYQLDVTNSASDWYFENQVSGTGSQATGAFNTQVTGDKAMGALTLGTVPVMGWVARDGTSCSYPAASFPNQQKVDPGRGCGNGVYPQGVDGCTNASGCFVTGATASATSQAVQASWAGQWVAYLVSRFGTAAQGGVAVYDLDNEPSWWDAVHRDVHPSPFTYDEVTNNGLAVAAAVKAADPTASVSGPVLDYWWDYFYSKKDVESGWNSPPCFEPWSNPVDREAHGGVAFLDYYLQQFAAYETQHQIRLLDYLDLHTYFAADNLAFQPAGNTTQQQARLNSTRVFWDPAYTDPNLPQPNYSSDANYTASCTTPLTAPEIIPRMHAWVAADYPGTKLAISEYNWGGQESINGALAQADILGIFGREGLDLATLWGAPDPSTQMPGLMAFEVYRNYDGAGAEFGNLSLTSTSADQGRLAIYGALRTADNVVTLVVLNKSYGDLTSTLAMTGLAAASGATVTANVWNYSNANLGAIVAQPAATFTVSGGGSPVGTATMTFPAQSITVIAIPQ